MQSGCALPRMRAATCRRPREPRTRMHGSRRPWRYRGQECRRRITGMSRCGQPQTTIPRLLAAQRSAQVEQTTAKHPASRARDRSVQTAPIGYANSLWYRSGATAHREGRTMAGVPKAWQCPDPGCEAACRAGRPADIAGPKKCSFDAMDIT